MNNPKINGRWNGEPAQCRVVAVIVGDEPENMKSFIEKQRPDMKRFLWFTPFIGQTRQAVEVTQGDATFYLDNNDGTGMHKVTNGGMWRSAHRTIYAEQILNEVPETAWVKCEEWRIAKEEQEIRQAWVLRDPIGYAEHETRMEALKNAFNDAKNRPDSRVKR